MTKLWVALVLKDKTKAFNDPQHDICLVLADTKENAIEQVINHEWLESWWVKGQSRCAILKILDASEMPSGHLLCNQKSLSHLFDYSAKFLANIGIHQKLLISKKPESTLKKRVRPRHKDGHTEKPYVRKRARK